MKRTILVLFILMYVFLSAKTFDFDLKKYRAKEYSYQAASIYFDSYGYITNQELDSDIDLDESSRNIRLYFRPRYSFSKYNPQYFTFLDISTYLSFNFSNDDDDNSYTYESEIREIKTENNNKTFYNQLAIEYEYDKYILHDFFAGMSGNIRINHRYRNYELAENIYTYSLVNDDTEQQKFQKKSSEEIIEMGLEPKFEIGFGRMESIFPARKAVYIFQDLEDAGLMSQSPNDEQIIKLANIINQINNSRFLDKRDKKIYAMETILEFLADEKLIAKLTPKISAIVYDVWASVVSERFYSYSLGTVFFERQSGYKFKLYAGFPMSFSDMERDDEGNLFISNISEQDSGFQYQNTNKIENKDREIENDLLGFSCGINHIYSNPFKLNWQFSTSRELFYQYSDYHFKSSEDIYNVTDIYDYNIYPDSNIQILQDTVDVSTENIETKEDSYQHELDYSFAYGIGYYYNIRTSFFARFSGYYHTAASKVENLFSDKKANTLYNTILSISSNYQISKKLILSGEVFYGFFHAKQNFTFPDNRRYYYFQDYDAKHNFGFKLALDYLLF